MAKKKEFRFESWFISQLRGIYRRYPPYYLIRNANKQSYTEKSKHGKDLKRVKFQCAQCKEWFKNSNISVDHLDPVVDPIKGFPRLENGEADWNTYIKRLYCPIENLQILCDLCHQIKTGKEKKRRNKKAKKT